MTSRDWSNLPADLFYKIAMALPDLESKDRLGMVCKNWFWEVYPILEKIAERKKAFYQVELALRSIRYKDAFDIIQSICKIDYCDLSRSERDLLYKCYFKVLISVRKKRARLAQIKGNSDLLSGERIKVEGEFNEVCDLFTDLIDSYLLPATQDIESLVFYKRIKS